MKSITSLKPLWIILITLFCDEVFINCCLAVSTTDTTATETSQSQMVTSLLEHRRRRGRRKKGRLRRRREMLENEDEPTTVMNHRQFQAWLDNLFRNQNRATADEIHLMEQSDPILSRYDPEMMSPINHRNRRQSKAFFEGSGDVKNADYDDAELRWD